VAALAVAVGVVALFHPLMQYLPLVLPGVAQVVDSGRGLQVLLVIEAAGLLVAGVLGVAGIVTGRGRAHGVAAMILALTVGAYIVSTFVRIASYP
jgi:hypothetical protein